MDNTFNPLNLDGRKIMVTGASSGIGRATSIYLSRLGASIVLAGRNEERLQQTKDMLFGEGHCMFSVDLAETDDLSSLFDYAVKDGDKLNGLVHSAGVSQVLPVKNLNRKQLQKGMNINYFVFIELVRQFSKKKYSQGGSIVGISSIAGAVAGKCQTNYSASKAAMDIAAQALALELVEKNIRINTVLPGAIKTEMVVNALEMGLDVDKNQILGWGEPEDVASICAFLISDMSRFITGRKFFVDGGTF